jgi:uncharacterized protein YrrD
MIMDRGVYKSSTIGIDSGVYMESMNMDYIASVKGMNLGFF